MKYIKLYEKFLDDITIDISDYNHNLIDSIIEELSLIIQKRIKRSLRITKISGKTNEVEFNGNTKTDTTLIDIVMSNKDKIRAKLCLRYDIKKNEQIGEIMIEINDKLVYDIEKDSFNQNIFVDKIKEQYLKYLTDNKWKML